GREGGGGRGGKGCWGPRGSRGSGKTDVHRQANLADRSERFPDRLALPLGLILGVFRPRRNAPSPASSVAVSRMSCATTLHATVNGPVLGIARVANRVGSRFTIRDACRRPARTSSIMA